MPNKIIVVVLLLSACSLSQTRTDINTVDESVLEQQWQQYYQTADYQNWQLQGRISMSNTEESWQARIIWKQSKDNFNINLMAAMIGSQMQLQGNLSSIKVTTHDNKVYYHSQPEEFLATSFGLNLPITGLQYWVLGLPDASTDYDKQLNAQARLARLSQYGWEIDYSDYDQNLLPEKLTLVKADWKIRLVIDQWNIN